MRLAKFLAQAGVASRRSAEEIVRSGRVNIADQVVTDPARDVGPQDVVTLDGTAVRAEPDRVVYAVNKPAGVVSTASDPQRRPTVVSLIDSELRLYPVGRLDIDTTGLILLTNDGELAHRLTHPSFEVPKTYRARVWKPPVSEPALDSLRAGVVLEDGPTAPAQVRRVSRDVIEITIHEGRKRQVKRMCEYVGHRVRSLERVGFGSLALGGLAPGAYRELSPAELEALTRSAGSGARPSDTSSPAARRRPRPG
jgi:23S rRNA pseudouridine2605 synthase